MIEKFKNMLEVSDFKIIYKIGHDSIRLMKWICYYDRSYHEIINYSDMMGSLCNYLNEISKR